MTSHASPCQASGFLALLSIAILSTATAYAQSDSTYRPNALSKGAWAMQFQVGEDFSLRSFQGTIVSAKYHLTESTALRFGLSMRFSADDNSTRQSLATDSLTRLWSADNSHESQQLNLIGQYLSYANAHRDVLFYWGAGPIVQFSRGHGEQHWGSDSAVKNSATYDSDGWNAGLSAVAGVEWFTARWLSLHAEYGVRVEYSWLTSTYSYNQTSAGAPLDDNRDQNDHHGWSFGASSILIGLSIYP